MRYLIPMPLLHLDDKIRFWGKVLRKSDSECWLWLGGCRTYKCPSPTFNIKNQEFIASRVAYAIGYGSVPIDKYVLHACEGGGNALCMNPKHLYLGDQFDNMRDRFAERPDGHKSYTLFEKREEFKHLWASGQLTLRELAKKYHSNYSRIYLIVHS